GQGHRPPAPAGAETSQFNCKFCVGHQTKSRAKPPGTQRKKQMLASTRVAITIHRGRIARRYTRTRIMRVLMIVFLASIVGCGHSAESGQEEKQPAPGVSANMGNDWPCFLGPLGTSVSTEKGIISPWPKDGLKIVWHKKIGTGYCAPTIRKG